MPSSATITAFYNFSANSKARASQVNNNFDVFRGHLLPVDPNTVGAAGNTYDLGSREHTWRNGFVGSTFINNMYLGQTTSNWIIQNETTTNAGNLHFMHSGTTRAVIAKNYGMTTAAGVGQLGASGVISQSGTPLTKTNIVGSTFTLQTIGKMVDLFFIPVFNAGSPSTLLVSGAQTTTVSAPMLEFYFMCDNTSVAYFRPRLGTPGSPVIGYSLGDFRALVDLAAGSHTFYLAASTNGTTTTGYELTQARFAGKEYY